MTQRLTVILVVLCLAVAGGWAKEKKVAQPTLPLDPDIYLWQFGMIPRDAWVSHHYALTNNHDVPVTITEIISDCDCTHTPKTPIEVKPGQTYLMRVEFDTKTYFGETNRDIHLVTDFSPAPEMTVYFTSAAARVPSTIDIKPRSTAFIPGKNEQTFTITNLVDEDTKFKFFVDNDSSLTVSEMEFSLEGGEKREITISPVWEKFSPGSHRRCVVLEVIREKSFRVTIPVKLNKY